MTMTVEQFLAQGGKIQKCAEGARALSEREIHLELSDEGLAVKEADKAARLASFNKATDHLTDEQYLVAREMEGAEEAL